MSVDWDTGPLIDGDKDREPSLRSLVSFYYGAHDMDTEQVGTRRYIAAYEAQIAKPASESVNEARRLEDKRDGFAAIFLPMILNLTVKSKTDDDPIQLAFDMADLCMKARKS